MSRFYSANAFYRQKFGCKVIKLALDGGFTCPNRDGTLSYDGCIFCSGSGSGDFAADRQLPLYEQYAAAKRLMSAKWATGKYIAYFQAFTNTYAPIERLRSLYYGAVALPDVVGISIATRPDCLGDAVIELLAELSKLLYVCVELGLQTADEDSGRLINRCFANDVYADAVRRLNAVGIDAVTHIIIGLPHESEADMHASADFAVRCGTKGIKLQLLHVLKGTRLADMYENGDFDVLTREKYVSITADIIEELPPDIVIHRITGDGARERLIAPRWSLDKRGVLNAVMREFKLRGSFQGSRYTAGGGFAPC